MTNSRIQGRYRFSFWNEIYEAVLAPYILFPTLLALINPRLGKFNVTAKGGVVRRAFFLVAGVTGQLSGCGAMARLSRAVPLSRGSSVVLA
jgi:hypothetical protein